jgi:tetratricopeptide (TPR) repeat protein
MSLYASQSGVLSFATHNGSTFRMRNKLLWIIVWLQLGCQKGLSDKEAWAKLETLSQSETSLQLAEQYLKFSQEFVESEHAPKALLKSAQLLDANGYTATAIERYREVVQRFPKSTEAAQASFLVGFAYSNVLGDTLEARKAFEQFLKTYPESELVPSARLELSLIGKSLDELFNPDSLARQ